MKEYAYKAFISYRHVNPDKKIAEKLQKMLEGYKPPREMCRAKEHWRIFRDETELQASGDLSAEIRAALENSEYLIVICSGETVKSRWCREEIARFKELHSGTNDNIITLIISGEPGEVLPSELRTNIETLKLPDGTAVTRETAVEPMAANIISKTQSGMLKKLNIEFLRIAAPLLGCGYDDLYNRNRRRRTQRLAAGAAAAFIGVTLFGVYSSVMLMKISDQRNQLQAKNEELELRTKELDISNGNLESTNDELNEANTKLEDANSELDAANTELDNTNSALTETNGKLDSANSTLTETNNKLDNANAALSKSNKDLDDANSTLKQTNDKLRETNTRLDKSNEELQEANSELDDANTSLTKSNADLAEKTKEANDNLAEADIQRAAAESNLYEATRQKAIAEQNLEYAEEQREIAEQNSIYAEEQRRAAEDNLAMVSEKNRELSIAGADMAARNAETLLADNDRIGAIETALSVRPYEEEPERLLPSSMKVLADATYAYEDRGLTRLDRRLEAAGEIKKCMYSPDGTRILAWDDTDTLYVWDVDSGGVLYEENLPGILNAAFTDNGRITAALYYSCRGIDIDTGDVIWERGYFDSDSVAAFAVFSPDGSIMCAHRSYEGAFDFIDCRTGGHMYLTDHALPENYYIETIWSPPKLTNGGRLCAVISRLDPADDSYERRIFTIDSKTRESAALYSTGNYVQDVVYAEDGSFVLLEYNYDNGVSYYVTRTAGDGTAAYSVKLEDYSPWEGGITLMSMKKGDEIYNVIAAKDSRQMVYLNYDDGSVSCENTVTGSIIKNVYFAEQTRTVEILCEDGSVYSGSPADDIWISCQLNIDASYSFLSGNDDCYAVIGTNKSCLYLYNRIYDSNYRVIEAGDNRWIRDMKFSRDGRYALLTDSGGTLVYDLAADSVMYELPRQDDGEYRFFRDNIAAIGNDSVTLYDTQTGEMGKTYDLSGYGSFFRPNVKETRNEGTMVFTINHGFAVITDTLREIDLGGDINPLSESCRVSPNGLYIAFESADYSEDRYNAAIVNTVSGKITNVYQSNESVTGYVDRAENMDISFDSSMLAVVRDGAVHCFNTADGTLINSFSAPGAAAVKQIRFAPDNSVILYSANNTIYRYDAADGSLLNSTRLERDEANDITTDVTLDFNIKENDIIITRGAYTWFIDVDTLDIIYRFGYGYEAFNEQRQELAFSPIYAPDCLIYPYYTSEQLIERAEAAVKGGR